MSVVSMILLARISDAQIPPLEEKDWACDEGLALAWVILVNWSQSVPFPFAFAHGDLEITMLSLGEAKPWYKVKQLGANTGIDDFPSTQRKNTF